MTVLAALSGITTSAESDGVTVTVNVEGRLIGLSLTPGALEAGPSALAALIFRLTEDASAAALEEGVAVLAPHLPPDLADELRASPLPRRESDEDYSTVETWAASR
jgi:hypothetical protein